ncbi:MFS transporter [Candidatus Comchoanobacter bicostacola]|uniref:MFS transporter n=1 Tax=Candidatus Comchoanobacter bicostacola TaxID=2919598 RepID=A0ABY5DKA7_9GAMM|nr:MFS transporter [Candidatus Comchoanobacter bicostacola]UTC24590.1 MFS transporter [Candidatus Comchoanobacter bicostacola]
MRSNTLTKLTYDSIKPWVVCLSAGLFFFYDFIQLNAFNALNPHVSAAFGLSAIQVGYLSSIYLVATVCMLPFSGALLDRFSTRKVILNAMGICIFSTLLFAISPNILVAAIARFLCGASTAFCFLSCIMLATRWFKTTSLAMVTGIIVTMAMVGGMMSQSPLALLIAKYGWRNVLILDGLLGVALLYVMYCNIEDQPENYQAPEKSQESFHTSYRKAMRNPQNLICGTYTALMNLFVFIFGAVWGINYLQTVYKLPLTTASNIAMVLFLGVIVGSPLAGKISDTIKKRKEPMVYGALLSLGLSLFLFSSTLSVHQLYLIFFLLGLTTSTQIIIYPTIFESNPPSLTGTCEALAAVVIMSAGAIFQPFFGFLMEQHASTHLHTAYTAADYQAAYWILPATLFVSLILSLTIKETNCKPIWKSQDTKGS